MVKYTKNIYADRIEIIGDMTLNLDYWDCECTGKIYIHNISETRCLICNAIQDDNPSSQESEVLSLIYDENIEIIP